jgi:hypothetical protein
MSRLDGTRALGLAIAAALVLPASASAATISLEKGSLVYAAAPGETNSIGLGGVGVPADQVVFTDQNRATTVPAPCSHSDVTISCPGSVVSHLYFDLGDGNDTLEAARDGTTSKQLPVSVDGDEGDDTIAGTPFDDVLSGGPGNDKLSGLDGNDQLLPQTGEDQVRAGAGDDEIHLDNEERDVGELMACEDGDDTIDLDERDQIIEYRTGKNSYTTEGTCEHVVGQTRAPRPILVFASGSRITIDLVDGLPTTIKVEFLVRKTVIARGTSKRKGPRTVLGVKLTHAGRKFRKRSFFHVNARVTVTDTGGRKSVTTKRLLISHL